MGFNPEIRVSLLSLLESTMLARTARRMDSEGHSEEAILSWRQAIFKDFGNVEHQRGLLRTLIHQKTPSERWMPFGVGQSFWLLRMTEGSAADRRLSAEFFSVYRLAEYARLSLKPLETQLDEKGAAIYLKACLETGYYADFGEALRRYPGAAQADPEIPVYAAAWEAAWGPAITLSRGRKALAEARKVPETAEVANRLQLQVSENEYDLETFSQALRALADFHADRPRDHVRHWKLLQASGQAQRARELAQSYTAPPTRPAELRDMFDAMLTLDLPGYAADFMQKHLSSLGLEPDLWRSQANLLIRLERWDDLRLLAIELRTTHQDLELGGYGWFLEGLVNLRYHLPSQAAYSFSRVVDRSIGDPLLGYEVAQRLASLGYPKLAAATLANLEHAAGKTADYWYHVTVAALQAGQVNAAAEAADKAYQLSPDAPDIQMNYAAILLSLRTNSPLAAQLTLRRLNQTPNDLGAILNHALALLQNNRLSEAETLLEGIQPTQLNIYEATSYSLALFELRWRQDRTEEALKAYKGIQTRLLLAPQSNWVQSIQRKIVAAKRLKGQ